MIYLELTNKANYDKALELAKSFDQYIGALDSGYFEAKKRNERIIELLKEHTVIEFTIKDYVPTMSNTKRDWRII